MKVWLPYIYGDSGGGAVFTERLADELRALGHEVICTSFPHKWQFFPWPLRYASSPSTPDVVVANCWWAFPFKRLANKLVIIEHHCVHDPAFAPYRSLPQAAYHEIFVRRFTARSLRAADALVCVSEHTAKTMASVWRNIDPTVILNGIETEFFCPSSRPKQPLDGQPVRLLYVGNLTRRKGADLLPEIMKRLGAGYELRYTSGLSGKEVFAGVPNMIPLGRLTRAQLRDAYREADLLLFPTRFEGFGYPVAEAMACGTPVVTTDCSALPELVIDGVTGRLCNVDDVEAFANAVKNLSQEPKLLNEMAIQSRRAAEEKFSITAMANAYSQLLERLIRD